MILCFFVVVGFNQLQVCIHPLNKYDIKYCLKKLMLQFRLKKISNFRKDNRLDKFSALQKRV